MAKQVKLSETGTPTVEPVVATEILPSVVKTEGSSDATVTKPVKSAKLEKLVVNGNVVTRGKQSAAF